MTTQNVPRPCQMSSRGQSRLIKNQRSRAAVLIMDSAVIQGPLETGKINAAKINVRGPQASAQNVRGWRASKGWAVF